MAHRSVKPADLLNKKIAALACTTMFGGADAEALQQLAALAEWRVAPAGAAVFRKGDPGDRLFVVHQGQVKISALSVDGREMTLNLLGRGTMFGEVAVADGGVRTADATATEATELVSIARQDLMTFLRDHPEMLLRMMVALSQQVRWVAESLEDTNFLGLPSRLAKRLLFLGAHFGQDTPEGRRLTVALPHHELASHMYVTRESVNRLLQTWRKEGLVKQDKRVLILTDLHRLNEIALKG
jgi:CRP-like cAMP-binding protein